jgi:hypothetical protein
MPGSQRRRNSAVIDGHFTDLKMAVARRMRPT